MGVIEFLSHFFTQEGFPSDLHPLVESHNSDNEGGQNRDGQPMIDNYTIEIAPVHAKDAHLIKEEKQQLIIDPSRGDWEESRDELKEAWVEYGRLFTESAFELYLSIEANKDDIENVLQFFKPPVLSLQQYFMLEEGYHLSTYFSEFDVSHSEEQERRQDLADKYDDMAVNLPSLCSAGYFNKEGLFPEVYRQIEPNNKRFQNIFNKLVTHRPFVVFVQENSNTNKIYKEITRKNRMLDNLDADIGYIHVRGIGSRGKINDVQEILDRNHPDATCVPMNTGRAPNSGEIVLAIDNSSI